MEIKTTIIIPNYNGLSFMEPCFESLKEQTVRNFKVLVVDNGSTDGSVEWFKQRYQGGTGLCGGHGAGHGPVAEDLFRQQPDDPDVPSGQAG